MVVQDGVVNTTSMMTETVDETVMEDVSTLKSVSHYAQEAEAPIEDPVQEALVTIQNGIDDK